MRIAPGRAEFGEHPATCNPGVAPHPMSEALPTGLDPALAAERLRAEGPNELGRARRRGWRAILLELLREPMFLLLIGAGAIYLAMGDAHEALVLLGFVLVIMALTALQQRRTERALEALREIASPRALALRGGRAQRIPGREVVREDLLLLAEGDRVPADGLLLQAHELATDESLLSGESEPVEKAPGARVFAGTLLVRGQGLMQVDAVGRQTELGRIGQSLQTIAQPDSPLRLEMHRLTRRLVLIGLTLCLALVLLMGALRGDWLQALLAGITLAMGVLPQEFPVLMIVFLALAARRLATRQVLARRLDAIETLGQTSVLCVDKTGTLTENRMAVAMLSAGGQALEVGALTPRGLPEPFHELLEYALLASETEPSDPMELAIHRLAAAQLHGTEHLHPQWSLAREYELSPELLAMSHLWRDGAPGRADIVATKGAPEAVADLCHLPPAERAAVAAEAARLADRGLRVLGVAKARHHAGRQWPDIQHDFDFEWLGLVGLADPLRAEVAAAIAECRRAGVRVVMITGDHPRTARAIAAQAGIEGSEVLGGEALAALPPDELARQAARVNVFARMRPQQKLALVEALKARGEVVAMTGDGVNDAPALQAAHIGIAMGQRGTDVAREAAALVLLQDDFRSIVEAIRGGRRSFANLRQALVYTLAVHLPIVGLALLPVPLGLPLVLAPLHIAFLELVIDPACSLVFEAEDGDPGLMARPPRRPDETLLPRSQVLLALLQGGLVTALVVGAYALALRQGMASGMAGALAFVLLVSANAALILPSRSASPRWRALAARLTPTSAWVLAGTGAALLLVGAVPPVAGAFGFTALPPLAWLAGVAAGLAMVLPFQVVKRLLPAAG